MNWWLILIALADTAANHSSTAVVQCPDDVEVAKQLGIAGTDWQITCQPGSDGRVLRAAFLPPARQRNEFKIVVSITVGGVEKKASLIMSEPAAEVREMASNAEAWMMRPSFERFGTRHFLRVSVFAKWGDDLFTVQEVVSFFSDSPDGLFHLWTGAGDRKEQRFETCLISLERTFEITVDGKLERITRSARRIQRQDLSDEEHRRVVRECVAPRRKREVFSLGPRRL